MKNKILICLFACLQALTVIGQTKEIKSVTGRIKDSFFAKKIQYYYIDAPNRKNVIQSYTTPRLPLIDGKMITKEFKRKNYKYPATSNIPVEKLPPELHPFVMEEEKPLENRKGIINGIFIETSGEYFIISYAFFTTDYFENRKYLFTYDYNGALIDYLLFSVSQEASPNDISLMEGILNKDMTVDTYQLDLNKNPLSFDKASNTLVLAKDLTGQRFDCSYKITKEGKFNLISKVTYTPQNYDGEYLTSNLPISKGGEIPLEYK